MTKDESTLRKEQAEKTKQKLLAAAKSLFSKNGYNGTSVRAISHQAELADGLLYHYLPGGKKELFQTIVAENFTKVRKETAEGCCYEQYRSLSIEEVLISGFNRFTDIIENNINIIRIIVKENNACDFISPKNIIDLTDCHKKIFADFLRRRAEEGEIKQMDFDAAAATILSYLVNYITMRAMNIKPAKTANDQDIKRIINYHMDIWKIK